MEEKKIGRIIILCAFIIIICSSKGIWFFAQKFMDSTNHENRKMAAQPSLTLDNYSTFANEYTKYFNDNLQFRNNLISLNSGIDYFCFKRSSSDYVIAGKDKWLFYNRKDDGDPIGCYQGTNLYTEQELENIADNCIKQRDFLASKGKEFVVFIAPNKERIYSEYMPEKFGKPAENYGALQIYNYLTDHTDLRVVYPYNDLIEAKNKVNENIYYKTDTHWNYIGGYIGAAALLSELGIEMPKVYSNEITINSEGEPSGDLAGMLNLSKQLSSVDTEYVVEGYDKNNCENIEWTFSGMVRYHASDADPRCIYVIRDSFSTHMALYIGSQFSDSYLRHNESYSYDELEACNPDIVVYEVAERYVDKLAAFSVQK
jgi:hypothetical protein